MQPTKPINIAFMPHEIEAAVKLFDLAVRSTGLQAAENALVLTRKLQFALQQGLATEQAADQAIKNAADKVVDDLKATKNETVTTKAVAKTGEKTKRGKRSARADAGKRESAQPVL